MNALKWGSGESSSERGEVRCKQFTVAKLEAAPTALRFAGGAVWGRWDSQPGWTVFLPRCGDVSEPLQAKAHSVFNSSLLHGTHCSAFLRRYSCFFPQKRCESPRQSRKQIGASALLRLQLHAEFPCHQRVGTGVPTPATGCRCSGLRQHIVHIKV